MCLVVLGNGAWVSSPLEVLSPQLEQKSASSASSLPQYAQYTIPRLTLKQLDRWYTYKSDSQHVSFTGFCESFFTSASEKLLGLRVTGLGRISKGEKCSISGCGKDAIRSVSIQDAKGVGLEVEGRRAYLCEEHYKAVKKKRKTDSRIQKWRYGV